MALKEFGFWVYTCPRSGRESHYEEKDWELLLDDMASAGMNSLAMVIKWYTTGYKSSLDWLDQDVSGSSIVAKGNGLLRRVVEMAHERKIKVWLVVVCSFYQIKEFGIVPPNGQKGAFHYDPDWPGVMDRTCLMFKEISEIFGDVADGMVVEIESVEFDWPHRIPLYNEWAKANQRPAYGEIKLQHMDARAYQKHDWRDFLTERRCLAMKEIEKTVRASGFKGKMSMICESCNERGCYTQAVNLEQYHKTVPGWAAVTYDYWRYRNRLAGVDFCMEQPRLAGIETYFLGRGVMSYDWKDMTIPLEAHWEIDLEDVEKYQPDGFWFFASDSDEVDNWQSCVSELKNIGFANGLQARKRLLELCGKRRLLKGVPR
ncbi:MAG: hypothetical protein WCS96_07530 [Victivallales bacterium]